MNANVVTLKRIEYDKLKEELRVLREELHDRNKEKIKIETKDAHFGFTDIRLYSFFAPKEVIDALNLELVEKVQLLETYIKDLEDKAKTTTRVLRVKRWHWWRKIK